MENFGLGLVLQFTDKASVGIGRVANTISALEQTARNASGIMNSLGQSMNALGSIGMTLSSIVTAPISGFLSKIMTWGINRASSVQQLEIAFESLMGSAKEAGQYLDVVMGYARTTPYKFDALAQTAQTLISYGMDANDVLHETSDGFGGLINALGDWSGAMAKGVSGIMYVSDTLGKIQALGKVDTLYVQSLERQGLLVSKMLGNMYGKTEAEMKDVLKNMDVKTFMSDLTRAIEEGTDGPNGPTAAMKGMVEKLKHTWEGAKDTFTSALTSAGQSLMGVSTDENGLHKNVFLDAMTESLNRISDSIKKIASVLQPLVDFVREVLVKGSEIIQKIATAYDELNDDTKKVIGNVVAVLVMLGPALILFSQFGTLIIKTIGFLKTFTTGMGVATLTIASALFAMSTNFGGMRMNLTEFLNTVMTASTKAFELIQKGSDLTKKEILNLKASDEWVDRLSVKIAKVIGFIKIMADAWSDFTISEENYELMDKLGITKFVEGLLIFKDRMTYFIQGLIDGVKNLFYAIKDSVAGTALEGFLDTLLTIVETIFHGDRDFFYNLGENIGEFLPVILAIKGLLPIISLVISGLGSIGNLFGNLLGGSGGFLSTLLSFFGGSSSDVFGKYAKIFGMDKKELRNKFYGDSDSLIDELFEKGFGEGNIIGAFIEEIASAGTGLSGVISSIGSALASPLGIVIAILAVVTLLYFTSEDVRDLINGIIKDILPSALNVVQSFFTFAKSVWSIIKSIWEVLKPVLEAICTIYLPIIGSFLKMQFEITGAIFEIIAAILQPLAEIFSQIMELIGVSIDFGAIWKSMSGIFKMVGTVIEYAIVVPLTAVLNVIVTIMKGIVKLANLIPGIDVKEPDWIKFPWQKEKNKNKESIGADLFGSNSSFSESLESEGENKDGILKQIASTFGGVISSNSEAEPSANNYKGEESGGLIDKVKNTASTLVSGNENTPAVNLNFEENSIVIQTNISSADEADKLAKELMRIMAREIRVNANTTQNGELKKSAEEMNYLLTGGSY